MGYRPALSFPLWAAAAIVAAEYIVFSFLFNSAELRVRTDVWALAGYLGSLAVLIVATAMGAVLAVQSNAQQLRKFLVARRLDVFTFGALAAHGVSVWLLWWLSSRILSKDGPPDGQPLLWLVVWTLVAIGSPLLAGIAAFPQGQLKTFLRTAWPMLLGGSVMGAGAWVAGQGSALLWEPLGPWTLRAVELSLNSLLEETVYDPHRLLIGSDRFQVILAPQCSGFEGVGLMTVFVGGYLLLSRRNLRFPQALLLFPLALAASLVGNVVRIVALILVGTSVSVAVAAGGFHARAGWLFFCTLAFTLVLTARRLKFFAREPSESTFNHPTAAYLLPFLTLVAFSLLTGLTSANVDLFYVVRILAVAAILLAFRSYYSDLHGPWAWTVVVTGIAAAIAFIILAPQPDAGRLRAWREEWQALPTWVRYCWTLVRVVGSVLVVPLAEELAFRGYALRRLINRDFESVSPKYFSLSARVISSAAFGAVHAGWVAGTVAGLLFGLIQIHTGSVGHAVKAHMVSNFVVAAYVILGGEWWLWL